MMNECLLLSWLLLLLLSQAQEGQLDEVPSHQHSNSCPCRRPCNMASGPTPKCRQLAHAVSRTQCVPSGSRGSTVLQEHSLISAPVSCLLEKPVLAVRQMAVHMPALASLRRYCADRSYLRFISMCPMPPTALSVAAAAFRSVLLSPSLSSNGWYAQERRAMP